MKRILIAAITLLAATLSSSAFAQDFSGFEVGGQLGYGFGSSSGSTTCDPPLPCAGILNYSYGPAGGLAGGHVGYNFQWNQFVLGLEGDAEGADVSGKNTPNFAGTPYTQTTSMKFDASVRARAGLAFWNHYLVYGTGGVAFGSVETTQFCQGCLLGGKFEDNTPLRIGWTAGAGAEYQFANNWSAGLEYRYTDLGTNNFASVAGNVTDHNQFAFNAFRLRLTYRFAPPPPPPPPMVVPAAAPAMAPAPPRTFLVFFDFDRYNLTPDARRVIEAAAASYKATGSARIDVSGFTDLAGTQAYNLRLSQRRADAVAGYLMKQGVPKNVLDVKWFGKEHPRVPTPDGVREPQNRRVEIMMP